MRPDIAQTMTPDRVELIARFILMEARSGMPTHGPCPDETPDMSVLVKRHVEGGVYVENKYLFNKAPASRTYISWGPTPGWTGYVRSRLSRVALRDALSWIVASVVLAKLRTGASYGDELAVARAIRMPLRPFVECACLFPDVDAAAIARAFDVTIDDVLARCAEVSQCSAAA